MAKLGVTHIKTPLIEASIAPNSRQDALQSIPEPEGIPQPPPTPQQSIVGAPSPIKGAPENRADPEIPHSVEELASLMKLSDQELLDRLIPDSTPDNKEE